jgi:hypothetical protein
MKPQAIRVRIRKPRFRYCWCVVEMTGGRSAIAIEPVAVMVLPCSARGSILESYGGEGGIRTPGRL